MFIFLQLVQERNYLFKFMSINNNRTSDKNDILLVILPDKTFIDVSSLFHIQVVRTWGKVIINIKVAGETLKSGIP